MWHPRPGWSSGGRVHEMRHVLARFDALKGSGIENVEPVLCAVSGEQSSRTGGAAIALLQMLPKER